MTPALPGDDCSRFLDAVLLSSKLESATTLPSRQA